jgi:hypothetical protein
MPQELLNTLHEQHHRIPLEDYSQHGGIFEIVREKSVLVQTYCLTLSQVETIATEVLSVINGLSLDNRLSLPSQDLMQSICDKNYGLYFHANQKIALEMSRLAFAWWSTSTNLKHLRIFGDRICCSHLLVENPRLYSLGHDPFYVVYPVTSLIANICLQCKCKIDKGEGVWQHGRSDQGHFLCGECQYEKETGFRPGLNKLRINTI